MKRINQKKQRLWQLILLALVILLASLTPVYAAGEESVGRGEKGSGEFVLMAADENGFIIAPEYVSYEEGQTIRLRESALRGLETKILKVDRRNRRMMIAIPFAGRTLET
ncbi:MAG: hypothetical protein IJM69_01205, partial [Firmicutes bacterium]|nr:hypothetical protein [Bacillota bacterium]